MVLADMPGSAKSSGHTGHSGYSGDRFSTVEGAKSSTSKKAQYYPMNPPQSDIYNPNRPQYDIKNLPLRTEKFYWDTIERLDQTTAHKDKEIIAKYTGIIRMTLAASSLAFTYPHHFPIDPFHLLHENCTAFIWDIWVEKKITPGDESVHISDYLISQLGTMVQDANSTLPPSFCGVVRNPHTKRSSQYKIFEWMALLHWYILPIGIELGFNHILLHNFAKFVAIVKFCMTIKPRSSQEIQKYFLDICDFLTEFEQIYVHGDPEKISRMRLCIFQLIHLPSHIEWFGSVKIGSQATMERTIGELGHKVRSKKAPFAHLAGLVYEQQLTRMLSLYYPQLNTSLASKPKPPLFSKCPIIKKDFTPGTLLYEHIQAISRVQNISLHYKSDLQQWGKLRLTSGVVLNSQKFELKPTSKTHRSHRYFEAIESSSNELFFGEAIAFYSGTTLSSSIVVYYQLTNIEKTLGTIKGVWSKDLHVLPINCITDVVGIWNFEGVYILRKHPGLEWLSLSERGVAENDGEDSSEAMLS